MHIIQAYARELWKEWSKDEVPLLAAAQAYYYVLSSVPLVILILSILPYFQFNPDQVITYMEELLPRTTVSLLEDTIISAVSEPQGGLLTIGALGTIWSASNGMNAFIQAVNTAYNVENKRSFLIHRLLSIGLTFLLIISLLVALILPVFGQAIFDAAAQILSLPEEAALLLQAARWIGALIVIILVLSILYKTAPYMKVPFLHVIPGAVTATVLWLLASFGFSIYINNFGNFSATYGSLGGIIILMIWFFLTGAILMIGAEINAVYHRRRKGR
ncbi:YihY/virulence factor BrkB family protein [Alkalicoccus urumqiensis]|uniref:Ribonuclease n=1 Tax=Alkalicoccus urumqiensis TaxID=1548213 RepID=A0A2P6MKU4_ALKUR|nr:YihY/virulence factor BrkB family protein [Alkalicoccus urumqiensis]PRO66902.1 ribonuclease [Alkalicoccus urumqiensis]